MKKHLPLIILTTVSILFYWISARSYVLQSSQMESMELFRLFMGISNLIALFVPLVLFSFYMLTSGLMFTLLDEKFDSRKMVRAISLFFLPVILNCLIYLIVLYDIDKGWTLQEMVHHRSSIGLSLTDMEHISFLFWLGFYLFFGLLTQHEFGISYSKAAAITFIPILMVMTGKYLFQWF